MQAHFPRLFTGLGLTALALSSPSWAEEADAAKSDAAVEAERPAETKAVETKAERVDRGRISGGATMGERHTYSMGTIQGTVQALDFNQGLIRLRSSGGVITLRSRPMDMADLNPGDVVALEYANYNGALWVGARDVAEVEQYAQFGTLTGNVTQVNKALGTVTVRGRTFRAHPEQLEQVIPGQFISLGYANVAGTNWIADIDPAFQGGTFGGSSLP